MGWQQKENTLIPKFHCQAFIFARQSILMLIKNLLVVLGLFSFSVLGAQTQNSIELGGWLGGAYYFGDLRTRFDLSRPGPAGGVIFRYNFDSRINFKAGISFARVGADDADSDSAYERARNLSFRSNIWDFAAQLDFNFMPYVHGDKEKWHSPYLLLGLSLYHFNPKATLEGQDYVLRDFGTEGQRPGEEYGLYQPALVYGFGYKFDISTAWSINVELSNRLLYTDYIDDVSGVYPDLDVLEASRGSVARALSDRSGENNIFGFGETGKQRGNSRKNDSIHLLGISLLYNIGWLDCPDITPF